MNLKEFLIDKLNKVDDISGKFKETILISEINNDNEQPPIEVSKEIVIDYLIKSGFELSDENYKQAEQMLISMQASGKSAIMN